MKVSVFQIVTQGLNVAFLYPFKKSDEKSKRPPEWGNGMVSAQKSAGKYFTTVSFTASTRCGFSWKSVIAKGKRRSLLFPIPDKTFVD